VTTKGSCAAAKAVFLVGGLGSNAYLFRYLRARLPFAVKLTQPNQGYGSIMKGAIIHKLGLDLVRARIMRRHYGIAKARTWRFGDPSYLKYIGLDGKVMCRGVMDWYVCKGQQVSHRQNVDKRFCTEILEYKVKYYTSIMHPVTLYSYEGQDAPEFKDISGIRRLCNVTVDLKKIPPEAFERELGPEGPYYEVSYDVAIVFGSLLEFRLVHEGVLLGQGKADYLE